MNNLNKILAKPELYTKNKVAFWDDTHISRQMLQAHLDPQFEGASRKLAFIEQSVSWIKEIVPPANYPSLLDLGCGPGIYAERFTKAGYRVTGVDFSKRSIAYARESAQKQQMHITYSNQDYLKLTLEAQFDFCTMIYCDYGALSTTDRQIVMQQVYTHLKPGGKFLLDVFSMTNYNCFVEKQTWENCESGGFWRAEGYLACNGFYKYPANATLEQIVVLTEREATPYYLWTTYFTKEALIAEAAQAGFQVHAVYSDVGGAPDSEDSQTLAIVFEK